MAAGQAAAAAAPCAALPWAHQLSPASCRPQPGQLPATRLSRLLLDCCCALVPHRRPSLPACRPRQPRPLARRPDTPLPPPLLLLTPGLAFLPSDPGKLLITSNDSRVR